MKAVFLVLAVLLPAVPAAAQKVLWQRVGVKDRHAFTGYSIVVGDVNRDGYDDIVAVVPAVVANASDSQIWTLSGRDGKTLRATSGLLTTRSFSNIAAAGDVDGDGIRDYAVVAPDPGPLPNTNWVQLRSGKDDRVIRQYQGAWSESFGRAILGDLDLDGDRKPDLVVTVPGEFPHGGLYAYSNAGRLLYHVSGTPRFLLATSYYPYALGKVGDLDRDGADDFVVGGYDRVAGQNAAFVLSGRTGKILVQGLGVLSLITAGCGDIDGDGLPDFAASSPTSKRLLVFSGKDGRVLRDWKTGVEAIASNGIDVDRDAIPDLVIGVGKIVTISGREGSTLFRIDKAPQSGRFGYSLALGHPQPGSRFPVLVTSEAYGPTSGSLSYLGRIRLFELAPPGVAGYGRSCKGTLALAPQIGVRDKGPGRFSLSVALAAPSSPALCFIGTSRDRYGSFKLPLRLDPFGFRGCELWTSIDVVLATTTSNARDRGFAKVDLPATLSAWGPLTLHAQWLSLGLGSQAPGGFSDALLFRVR